MAATAVSSPVVSLKSQATIPVRLGSSIRKPSESRTFTSIRYNHKPRIEQSKSVKSSVSALQAPEKDELKLDLQDGDKKYAYLGKYVGDADSYVLFAKGSGKDVEMILEKLDTCREFNLVRTPNEKSARALSERYPQLPEDDGGKDDLFGEDDAVEEEPPDVDNPFDYRNYLKSNPAKAKPRPTEAPRSGASTPITQPRPASTTPHSRPSKRTDGPLLAQKKRKAQDAVKPNPKRVKAGTDPPISASTAAPPARKDIPKVRVDRKASLRLEPFDDSGELIVEKETPVQEKPLSAMALALTGQLNRQGHGPISLHSAASSPGSRIASPLPPRPDYEEGEEFELGGDSSPEISKRQADERGGVDDEDADANADDDVEDLALPSPAQSRRQPQAANVEAVEERPVADDEDDLDKQLALAMAEEDDGDALPMNVPAESDEESEEE